MNSNVIFAFDGKLRCAWPARRTPKATATTTSLPTSVYGFMLNVGVVNDRLHGCFRATDFRPA